jgi:hypothetical protein
MNPHPPVSKSFIERSTFVVGAACAVSSIQAGQQSQAATVAAGLRQNQVVLALAELDPSVGGDILAYASTGTDFPASAVARTILPNDNKHGRRIPNLYTVELTDVPEPAPILVLAGGLGVLALARRRACRQDA